MERNKPMTSEDSRASFGDPSSPSPKPVQRKNIRQDQFSATTNSMIEPQHLPLPGRVRGAIPPPSRTPVSYAPNPNFRFPQGVEEEDDLEDRDEDYEPSRLRQSTVKRARYPGLATSLPSAPTSQQLRYHRQHQSLPQILYRPQISSPKYIQERGSHARNGSLSISQSDVRHQPRSGTGGSQGRKMVSRHELGPFNQTGNPGLPTPPLPSISQATLSAHSTLPRHSSEGSMDLDHDTFRQPPPNKHSPFPEEAEFYFQPIHYAYPPSPESPVFPSIQSQTSSSRRSSVSISPRFSPYPHSRHRSMSGSSQGRLSPPTPVDQHYKPHCPVSVPPGFPPPPPGHILVHPPNHPELPPIAMRVHPNQGRGRSGSDAAASIFRPHARDRDSSVPRHSSISFPIHPRYSGFPQGYFFPFPGSPPHPAGDKISVQTASRALLNQDANSNQTRLSKNHEQDSQRGSHASSEGEFRDFNEKDKDLDEDEKSKKAAASYQKGRSLVAHERYRTMGPIPEKSCDDCELTFTRPADLKRHLNTALVHNQRSYKCRLDGCNYVGGFTRLDTLRFHMAQAHGLSTDCVQLPQDEVNIITARNRSYAPKKENKANMEVKQGKTEETLLMEDPHSENQSEPSPTRSESVESRLITEGGHVDETFERAYHGLAINPQAGAETDTSIRCNPFDESSIHQEMEGIEGSHEGLERQVEFPASHLDEPDELDELEGYSSTSPFPLGCSESVGRSPALVEKRGQSDFENENKDAKEGTEINEKTSEPETSSIGEVGGHRGSFEENDEDNVRVQVGSPGPSIQNGGDEKHLTDDGFLDMCVEENKHREEGNACDVREPIEENPSKTKTISDAAVSRRIARWRMHR